VALQIPVFFSLYKVLFVTIEMRHAPFYGWIKDLSAPDPTNLFTLFGLLHFDPTQLPLFGHYLALGVWPIIMGITMWFQMKLNPTPPDPTQKMIFDWMPLIFTFMLAGFPAGLVIYWAWNNLLSVLQQSFIMRRNGVKVELFAGDWQFFWASPSIETLPPMAGMEVAFAGRSNVGKSSLINALTGRNALARTSHTPGRTQELIFFEGPGNAGVRLVDMPGYGYASAPKAKVASWTALIHKFL